MAARKGTLHAVGKDEKPAPRRRKVKPKSLTEAATDGTERELLVAMRIRLAETLEDKTIPAGQLPALMKQLSDLTAQIRALDGKPPTPTGGDERNDDSPGGTDEEFDSSAI